MSRLAQLLLIFLVTMSPFAVNAKVRTVPNTVFYVCAHPDDCILFMNPDMYDDIAHNTDKVVLLYLTSGDAGEMFKEQPSSYPYARELASVEATKWIADMSGRADGATLKTTKPLINGHRLTRREYAHTVSYFLRLPDGMMMGEGFERTYFQSLHKLETDKTAILSPIDGRAAYKSWQELVDTLSDIVSREAADGENIAVHMDDPDVDENPHDHSDHTTSARAMLESLGNRCANIYKHKGYSIAEMSSNIDGEALHNKVASFAVLSAALNRLQGTHNWDSGHIAYLHANYYRATLQQGACK